MLRITRFGKVWEQVPNTTEPGKTVFAHLGINPITKADLIIQALQKLDTDHSEVIYPKTEIMTSGWMLRIIPGLPK